MNVILFFSFGGFTGDRFLKLCPLLAVPYLSLYIAFFLSFSFAPLFTNSFNFSHSYTVRIDVWDGETERRRESEREIKGDKGRYRVGDNAYRDWKDGGGMCVKRWNKIRRP